MISPLAHIHPNTKIGKNVTIEPFAVIYDDVEIGDGTVIMPNVTVFERTTIGKNCRIFPSAVVGAVPQDLKYGGEITSTVIGNNTTIREFVTIHSGTTDKWITKVGDHCLLMAYAHVAHDCVIGNHVILANAVQLAGHVLVDDYAIIGGLTGAHQFTHIGAHTYVAGSSKIRKDVPPYIKAAREPLSYAGINSVGLNRRGFSKEAIEEISRIYHILFVQGHTTSVALEMIERNMNGSPICQEILSFIQQSEIGIIKRHKDSTDEDNLF